MKRKKTAVTYRSTRGRRIVIGLIILIVVAVSGAVKLISSPVHGTHAVPVQLPKKQPAASATTTAPDPIDNQYYSLHLPAGYNVQAGGTLPAGLLAQQTIIKPSSIGSQIISISVKTMPDGGLASDSAYNLRSQQTDRYRLSSQIISEQSVTVAVDTTTSATVTFWAHNGYLATISVTSSLESANSSQAYLHTVKQVIDSWQWL